MPSTLRAGLLLAAAAAMFSVPASATPIVASGSGLASADYTITFSEVTLPNGALLTNEYAAFGVTFSPNAYYDPQPGYFATPSVGDFSFCCGLTVNPTTLAFSTPLRAVAFQFITNPDTTTFTSYLSGVPVETFTSATNFSYLWFGFQNSLFDRIDIDVPSGNHAFLLDNMDIQTSPVPEPASLTLVGFGLAAAYLRKRRQYQ